MDVRSAGKKKTGVLILFGGYYRMGAVALCAVFLMILSVTGCGLLAKVRSVTARKPAQDTTPVAAVSRLDSLWGAELPADTLVLETESVGGKPQEAANGERWMLGTGVVDLSAGKSGAEVPGYRVQLASADKRGALEKMKLKVEREMKTAAYLDSLGGRFTLRIGDFREKKRAEVEKQRAVSYGYEHAWIVQTKVRR
ncbi:MAG: hypothetical protein U9P14_05855 [Gemmatimonadota bacterium]|nr:hypothetical protein [Gemmatimonadota bacterium]